MLEPATKEQLLDQSTVMSEAWALLKKYANIDKKDEESWEMLISETNELCKKHGNSKYSREILGAVVNEIERISRGK